MADTTSTIASTYNPEIANLISNEGGAVVYQSGNIIVASEVSVELFQELIKSPYIESLETLPLKSYTNTQTTDSTRVTYKNTTVAFGDLDNEIIDDENVPGAGGVSSDSTN